MPIISNSQQLVGYASTSTALASSISSIALNAILAAAASKGILGIKVLGIVSVILNALCASSLVFFIFCFISQVKKKSTRWTNRSLWTSLIMGVTIASTALATTGAVLVWISVRLSDFPEYIAGQARANMLIGWWIVWAVHLVFQVISFAILGWWTIHRVQASSMGQVDLDFGTPEAPQMEERPHTHDTAGSFRSQDPTITVSPPHTPPSAPLSNHSSLKVTTSKVRPSNSRTKLINQNSFPRGSAKSSLDFTGTEISSVDDGFDRWDTSGVGREMRRTLQAGSPAIGTVSTLEPIPGSRPESPAKPLDGPFLPDSPHATTTEATNVRVSFSNHKGHTPTLSGTVINFPLPPSSPPNFSRPTSQQLSPGHGPPSLALPPPGTTMEELIHPLFRTNSPSPPPNPTAGTSVHAAPMAGQTVSHRSISRMRSGSLPRHTSPIPEDDGVEDEGPGSPGPSIVDEEDMPPMSPILPGFILSAGQRSSFLGYGKRKTTNRQDGIDEETQESAPF